MDSLLSHLRASFRERFRNRDVVFIEIGCWEGGSLQMWKRYLGPHARIIGIDIDPRCAAFAEEQIEIRIGDQSDPAFLASVVEEFGPPDVVLDDGSHRMSLTAASFAGLYWSMRRDGVYMVEDLQTAYWDEFEGGLRRPGTFIEHCKNLIDELNAEYSRGALAPTEFTLSTASMHFYNAVAVFEKGRHTKRLALVSGRNAIGQRVFSPMQIE